MYFNIRSLIQTKKQEKHILEIFESVIITLGSQLCEIVISFLSVIFLPELHVYLHVYCCQTLKFIVIFKAFIENTSFEIKESSFHHVNLNISMCTCYFLTKKKISIQLKIFSSIFFQPLINIKTIPKIQWLCFGFISFFP